MFLLVGISSKGSIILLSARIKSAQAIQKMHETTQCRQATRKLAPSDSAISNTGLLDSSCASQSAAQSAVTPVSVACAGAKISPSP